MYSNRTSFLDVPALNGPLAGVLSSKQHPNSDVLQPTNFFFFLQIRLPFFEASINGFAIKKKYLIGKWLGIFF